MPQEKFWIGSAPQQCDIDQTPLVDEFVDGATRTGPWANMCPECFKKFGIGLGVGRGQHYVKQPDGRWKKVG